MTRDDWFFEPHDFIRYLRATRPESPNRLRLPSRIVLVFGAYFQRVCSTALRARRADWNSSISLGYAGRRSVAVVRSTIGAPASAIDLEESIALGAQTIIAFGSCGSVSKDLPIGLTVLPTAAYSDEGTSKHYGGSRWARPDPELVRRLRGACHRRSLPVREGTVWTIDAVYRESRSRARALAQRGVVGVDMEASALYTIGRFRRTRVASRLAVSDELAGDAWYPGFTHPTFRQGVRASLQAVVDVMSGGIP